MPESIWMILCRNKIIISHLCKKETSQVFHNDNDFINVKWFHFIKFICFFRIQRPVKVLKSTLEKIYSIIIVFLQILIWTSQTFVDDVKILSAQVSIYNCSVIICILALFLLIGIDKISTRNKHLITHLFRSQSQSFLFLSDDFLSAKKNGICPLSTIRPLTTSTIAEENYQ